MTASSKPAASLQNNTVTFLMLGSALGGAVLCAGLTKVISRFVYKKNKKLPDPEKDYAIAHDIVWKCIGGAMHSSMLYIGDKLDLYSMLRECCKSPGSSVTAVELAKISGFNQRWLREWLAQQAAMGILVLLPGEGDDDESLHYRLPRATAQVLADKESQEYDIAMIALVPSLVNRAKTMLPEAFRTGIGRPYDEPEVAEGINRQHSVYIRDIFLPEVVPAAENGRVLKMLQNGCQVADLGCGGGCLLIAMAKAFPNSTFHGYEISETALDKASHNIASAKLRNVFLHNANEESLGSHANRYSVVTTFDVLHDAPNPSDLIAQVKSAILPEGVWLLADIPSAPTVRQNLVTHPTAGLYWAFSTCLCMSCSLSVEGGEGLGTLGFSVPVATKMLKDEGGFDNVKVLLEKKNARWFVVT